MAVVHGADDLSTEQMQSFANWTNLSETTFLLRPSNPDAELSFAAPPLRRSGLVEAGILDKAITSLGVDRHRVLASNWVDNRLRQHRARRLRGSYLPRPA